jgi:hypothetical protein
MSSRSLGSRVVVRAALSASFLWAGSNRETRRPKNLAKARQVQRSEGKMAAGMANIVVKSCWSQRLISLERTASSHSRVPNSAVSQVMARETELARVSALQRLRGIRRSRTPRFRNKKLFRRSPASRIVGAGVIVIALEDWDRSPNFSKHD